MSLMMDGLAPRSGVRRQPVLQLSKPEFRRAPSPSRAANVIDLRPSQPSRLAMVAAPALAMTTEASAPLPIPARKPLPSLLWLLAGGATAAILAGGVIGITKVVTAPAKATAAPAATQSTTTPKITSSSAVQTQAAAPAATPAVSVTSAQIKALLDDFSAAAGAPVYMVVKDLKTGETASSSNAGQTITSASLYKLFVAHGIYRLIDNGKLSLSSKVPGTGSNVGDCLAAMITVSDNACGEAMEGMLGDSGYNQALAEYGFKGTRFDYPTVTSASDVALLLERLYDSTLLSPNTSQQFIGLLKNQRINNRLPQGLPAGTTMAHKTGDVFGFVHDAGIVYGPKTDYLVVMMSGSWNKVTNAPPKFAELSQKLYTLFSQ